jgi:hypothetical protein
MKNPLKSYNPVKKKIFVVGDNARQRHTHRDKAMPSSLHKNPTHERSELAQQSCQKNALLSVKTPDNGIKILSKKTYESET